MFLFLSKLLPLLVYPLGLTCLLLVVALGCLGQRPGWARSAIAAALMVLFLSSNSWVAARVVQSLEWRYQPPKPMPTADVIVVLGGSTYAATAPRPWVEVNEAGDRVIYAVHLYQQGKAPLLLFSGGRIDWKNGGPPEADDMSQIALAMGVPRHDILQEPNSLNTYQNAVNVQAMLRQQQLDRVLLVTSATHMPRAAAIFRKLGIDIIPAPTDYWVSQARFTEDHHSWQGRLLGALPTAEAMFQITRAFKEYMGLAVYRLKGWL
ncbi:MAG: YdcF family protein [Cyanobacteria bacterium P01_A01_bin.105]